MKSAEILSSLDRVGNDKAVGYLPLNTIVNVLKLSIGDVRQRYGGASRCVVVFDASETCIKSGALFVYDPALVENLTQRFEKAISAKRWDNNPHQIVREVAASWFEDGDEIMPFIRALYADAGPTSL